MMLRFVTASRHCWVYNPNQFRQNMLIIWLRFRDTSTVVTPRVIRWSAISLLVIRTRLWEITGRRITSVSLSVGRFAFGMVYGNTYWSSVCNSPLELCCPRSVPLVPLLPQTLRIISGSAMRNINGTAIPIDNFIANTAFSESPEFACFSVGVSFVEVVIL